MKRSYLKQKEAKKLLSELREGLKILPELLPIIKAPVELAKVNGEEIFIISHKLALGRANGTFFPVLKSRLLLSKMPRVVVDMGAISHVCNGADVMAPGILKIKGLFEKDDVVIIVDEQNRKPIAIGIALRNSLEIATLKRGKAFKTVHYVGDKLWNAIKHVEL